MTFEDRQTNIDSFNEDESVRIFLLSTRAGGLVSAIWGSVIEILH
jgi:SNF2 family DNA or RNA helicase